MSLAIAVVCYPGLGGSGVIASELASGMAARGHDVTVLATVIGGEATNQLVFLPSDYQGSRSRRECSRQHWSGVRTCPELH